MNIRFANYSTMMRAHTLTAGLNAQLAMFLKTLGKETDASKKEDQAELTKKLLETAGIKEASLIET